MVDGARALRLLRSHLGLTQAALAAQVGKGLHQSTISDIERGVGRLTGPQALRLFEEFHGPLAQLHIQLGDLLRDDPPAPGAR